MNIYVPGGVRASLRVSAELRECLVDVLSELGVTYPDADIEHLFAAALQTPRIAEAIRAQVGFLYVQEQESGAA